MTDFRETQRSRPVPKPCIRG